MSRAWKKYSPYVYVGLGLTITGALWFDRANPTPTACDIAEIVSGVRERQTWYRHMGFDADEVPAFPSNNVSEALLWQNLYGIGMDEARAMAVDDDPQIAWMSINSGGNPEHPADGDYLVQVNNRWELKNSEIIDVGTYETYELEAINKKQVVWGCTDAHPGDGQKKWPAVDWAPGINAPIAALLGYHDADPEHGAWWSDVLGFTNINYKFDCERMPGVGIVPVWGSHFEIIKDWLEVAESNETATVSYRARGEMSEPRVSIFRTDHKKGRYGDGDEAYFGYLYMPPGQLEIWTTTPLYSYSSAANWQARLNTYVRTEIPEGVTNQITIRQVYASHPSSMIMDPQVYTQNLWNNSSRTIPLPFVRGYKDDDHHDAFIVWEVEYLGKTYQYLIRHIDTGGSQPDLSISPSGNTITDLAPHVATLKLHQDIGTWPPTTGQHLSTNTLAQSIDLLRGLRRTIAVLPPNSLGGTNLSIKAYSADNVNIISEHTPAANYSLSEAFGEVKSALMSEVSESIILGRSFDGVLFSSYGSASSSSYYWRDPGEDEEEAAANKYHNTGGGGVEVRHITKAQLPYPSAAACASGLVSRISIYAVCSSDSDLTGAGLVHYPWNPDIYPPDFEQYYEYNFMSDVGLQGASAVPWARLPHVAPGRPTNSETLNQTYVKPSWQSKGARLTLIEQVNNPQELPMFDLIADINELGMGIGAREQKGYRYTWTDYLNRIGEIFEDFDRLNWDFSVRILKFIVIVDWNWEYASVLN